MKRKTLEMLLFSILVALYVGIFLLPHQIERFALEYVQIAAGEWWRFATYSFSHLTIWHLLANVAGVTLLFFLLREVKANLGESALIYFCAAIVAALPVWLITRLTILGASSAIYAGFGMASFELPRFDIKAGYAIVGLSALILGESLLAFVREGLSSGFIHSANQALLHLSGLYTGCGLFLLARKLTPYLQERRYAVLQRSSDE